MIHPAMLQQTLLFLATETTQAQAVPTKPPAHPLPAANATPGSPVRSRARHSTGRIRLALNVAGNMLGFAGLLAGMWFSLVLMQGAMPAL